MRKPNGIILAYDRGSNQGTRQLVIKDYTGIRYISEVRKLG
jgi:hypothetical protein